MDSELNGKSIPRIFYTPNFFISATLVCYSFANVYEIMYVGPYIFLSLVTRIEEKL
jgi:hypothetical protein